MRPISDGDYVRILEARVTEYVKALGNAQQRVHELEMLCALAARQGLGEGEGKRWTTGVLWTTWECLDRAGRGLEIERPPWKETPAAAPPMTWGRIRTAKDGVIQGGPLPYPYDPDVEKLKARVKALEAELVEAQLMIGIKAAGLDEELKP